MAIEEKQKTLEFTYKDGNIEFDISYDESKGSYPLTVATGGGNAINYPLELLVEIVDFLTSKGVIKSEILSRTIPTPGMPSVVMATSAAPAIESSIPLPEIKKKERTVPTRLSANVDPLASFDISMPTVETHSSQNVPASFTPPIPKIVKKSEGIVVTPTPVVPIPAVLAPAPVAITKEMTNRSVIRSRVRKGDPFSAETAASDLRAAKSAASGKTIRKAHRGEGD